MKFLVASLLALIAFGSGPLAAREMTCSLYSAKDSTELLHSLLIHQGEDGTITFQNVEAGTGLGFLEKTWQVLFSSTTNYEEDGDRFSTVVIEATYQGKTYVPVVWFIDWRDAVVSHTNLGAGDNIPTIFERYICGRVS